MTVDLNSNILMESLKIKLTACEHVFLIENYLKNLIKNLNLPEESFHLKNN
jgi:hypothetical protein